MEKVTFDISKMPRDLLEKMYQDVQKNKDTKKKAKKGA